MVIKLVLLAIDQPAKIALYDKNNKLAKIIELEGRLSEALPKTMQKLLKEYDFSLFAYANGPGSYMALKIAYVFFSTLALAKNIEFRAIDGFCFSKNNLIKATNNMFFCKENEKIILKPAAKLQQNPGAIFDFSQEFLYKFQESNLPNYFLPAL